MTIDSEAVEIFSRHVINKEGRHVNIFILTRHPLELISDNLF